MRPLIGQDEKKPDAATKDDFFADERAFNVFQGKWNTTIRSWPGKTGDPPQESKGSVEFSKVLDGKFLKETATGKTGEKKFSGIGYWAYDSVKKKFTRTWMDSLSSSTTIAEGTADKTRQLLTFYGKVDDPLTGQHDKMMRYELDLSDKSKIVLKVFDLSIHKDTKVLEIVYQPRTE